MVPRLEDSTLDDEHEQLQQLIDAFAAGGLAQAAVSLEALRAYAAHHFAGEDDDLRAMKSGNSDCHVDEHAAVLTSLTEVLRLVQDPQRDTASNERLVAALAAELQRWFAVHVDEMDRALAAFRFRARTGGSFVQLSLPRRTERR